MKIPHEMKVIVKQDVSLHFILLLFFLFLTTECVKFILFITVFNCLFILGVIIFLKNIYNTFVAVNTLSWNGKQCVD